MLEVHFRRKQLLKTDERVKLLTNIITGIQMIKMYAWEKPFEALIEHIRNSENCIIRKLLHFQSLQRNGKMFMEKVCVFGILICYVLLRNKLESNIVFSISQYFFILQLIVSVFGLQAIHSIADILVGIKRIENFLLLQEKSAILDLKNERRENAVELININASWNSNDFHLKNFSCKIPHGSLCAIVGPTGAGKTTFLQILLGELKANSGELYIDGKISYASQKSWIFSSTVKQNIVFCEENIGARYEEVIKVCQLEEDFIQFPKKDNYLVGDRGSMLSGGQKARINLARAVYRDADIYIFDDPLSAVDPKVAKNLFNDCICQYLDGKTRILVTHQVQYLKKADKIIVLNNVL